MWWCAVPSSFVLLQQTDPGIVLCFTKLFIICCFSVFVCFVLGWLAGWFVWLANWLVGCLLACLVGCLFGRSVDRFDFIWCDLTYWNVALASWEFLLDRRAYVELVRAMISLDGSARLHSLRHGKVWPAATRISAARLHPEINVFISRRRRFMQFLNI